jgi:o-succinylbenzoate synthase
MLEFKFAARTSRGPIDQHKTWIIKIWDDSEPLIIGYGESAPFEGLSIDDLPDFGDRLNSELNKLDGAGMPKSLAQIDRYLDLIDASLPAVVFGLEIALLDLYHGGHQKIIDSDFYNLNHAIDINGLVWMGNKDEMLERLEQKVMDGYDCIKLKIGALDLKDELNILRDARRMIGNDDLTLRVDANGAFSPENVSDVLEQLSEFHLYSIEQPIKPGQLEVIADLCANSPIPIALDEELIGIIGMEEKRSLLEKVKPQFIVLKPTLLGGFKATREWIEIAEEMNIGWWITSALESNIGLNAICQFTSQYKTVIPQGLGTGDLYTNNIPSPLTIKNGCIFLDKNKLWYLNLIGRQG